jgi:uncharacterized protein
MEHFTPISAAIGGSLIGLAAALLWLSDGRIAGISGIVGGLLSPGQGDFGWRIAFILGLLGSPILFGVAGGAMSEIDLHASWLVLAGAGLLVGFGTRLGSGCTSGHGVCGLARLSPRSAIATAIFIATAILTAYVRRRLSGI